MVTGGLIGAYLTRKHHQKSIPIRLENFKNILTQSNNEHSGILKKTTTKAKNKLKAATKLGKVEVSAIQQLTGKTTINHLDIEALNLLEIELEEIIPPKE